VQQQAATLQSQTSRFQIFQAKEADLNARTSAVDAATTGRIDWARMLDELGLVLPTDVYLTSFTGTDAGSGASGSAVTLAGQAVDEPDDTPDHGYKSIATMLVRLADMRQLDSVWLTNMSLGQGTESAAPMITWSANARVTPSTTSTAN
jgi:Tfp pilus assembly protein PilN